MKLVEKPEKPWRGKFVLVAPSSIKSKSYGKGWEGMGLKWIVDGIGVDKCGLMRNWCRLPFSRCQHMPTISQIYPIFQYVPICSNYFHISSIFINYRLIMSHISIWFHMNPLESNWIHMIYPKAANWGNTTFITLYKIKQYHRETWKQNSETGCVGGPIFYKIRILTYFGTGLGSMGLDGIGMEWCGYV